MVDVIMPVYNSADFIEEALESVLAQTYQPLRIWVINDGSSDQTPQLLKSYERRYPDKIRILHKPNGGPASARNMGLQKTTAPYIAFLDADDIWLPQKLEKEVAVLKANPAIGLVYCDNFFVNEHGATIENYIRKVGFYRGAALLDFFMEFFLMIPGVVVRQACFMDVGLFDENLQVGEDFDLFLRILQKYPIECVREKLWKRRVLSNSLSRRDFILAATNDLKTVHRFLERNPDFYVQFEPQINERLAQLHFSLAYQALEKGKNDVALKNFLASLERKFSLVTVKNIALCSLPYQVRTQLKKTRTAFVAGTTIF